MNGPSYASMYGALAARLEEREALALREYRRARALWMDDPFGRQGRTFMRSFREVLAARARWSTLASLLDTELAETDVAA